MFLLYQNKVEPLSSREMLPKDIGNIARKVNILHIGKISDQHISIEIVQKHETTTRKKLLNPSTRWIAIVGTLSDSDTSVKGNI